MGAGSSVIYLFISHFGLWSVQILVETGHMGRQASGAVTATDGETVSGFNFCPFNCNA